MSASRCPSPIVAHLRQIGEVVTFAPGETMVAFGAPNEAFFYILDGEAAAWDEVTGARYGNATLGPRSSPER